MPKQTRFSIWSQIKFKGNKHKYNPLPVNDIIETESDDNDDYAVPQEQERHKSCSRFFCIICILALIPANIKIFTNSLHTSNSEDIEDDAFRITPDPTEFAPSRVPVALIKTTSTTTKDAFDQMLHQLDSSPESNDWTSSDSQKSNGLSEEAFLETKETTTTTTTAWPTPATTKSDFDKMLEALDVQIDTPTDIFRECRRNPETVFDKEPKITITQPLNDERCWNMNQVYDTGFVDRTPDKKYFDAKTVEGIKSIPVPSWNLQFCGRSQGIFNPNFLCINPKLCKTQLSLDHPFHKINEDFFAIGIARSGAGCERATDQQRQNGTFLGTSVFFVTKDYEIKGYTFFKWWNTPKDYWTMYQYDCRLFVANDNVHAWCASGNGSGVFVIGYDGHFFWHKHYPLHSKTLPSGINSTILHHSGERNLIPLPCGHTIHFRLWPHKVLKWNSHSRIYEIPGHPHRTDARFATFEVEDTDEFAKKMHGDVNQKALHQSAGFLEVPFLPGTLLGVAHDHGEYGSPDNFRKGGYMYGYRYSHRFFTIESEWPHRTNRIGKHKFCIARLGTYCEEIQFIMSMVDMNNGSVLVTFGKQDCESAVAMFTWKHIKYLLLGKA